MSYHHADTNIRVYLMLGHTIFQLFPSTSLTIKKVCLCFVLFLLFCCLSKVSIAASSNSRTSLGLLYCLELYSGTLSLVCQQFLLSICLFQDFDYFPLYSSNLYLVARRVYFQISWSTLNPSLYCPGWQ